VALFRSEHPMRIVIVVAILLIAVNAAIIGARAQQDGPAETRRPQQIVDISPAEGETQIPQAPVEVDLRTQYTGQLTIDHHLIPEDQITGDPNLGQLIFTPGPNMELTELPHGANSAVVEYWPKTFQDADHARAKGLLASYSWSFHVA
jgi:hypothetical protein